MVKATRAAASSSSATSRWRARASAAPQAAPVPAGKDTTLLIPLDVNFLSAGTAAAQAIKTGIAEVKIDSTLNAAGATLPFRVAKTVEFQRRPTGSSRWRRSRSGRA